MWNSSYTAALRCQRVGAETEDVGKAQIMAWWPCLLQSLPQCGVFGCPSPMQIHRKAPLGGLWFGAQLGSLMVSLMRVAG